MQKNFLTFFEMTLISSVYIFASFLHAFYHKIDHYTFKTLMLPKKLKTCKTEIICLQTNPHSTSLFKKATNIFKNLHIWKENIRNANDNSVFVLFTYLFCSHFQNIFAGWLYKRGNDGLKLWKKRYFVLSEYCLSYYKSPHDEKASGSILLPSYRISPVSKEDGVPRKFAFKAEHHNMRTYFFAADSQSNMIQWMNALSLASILQSDKR